VTLGKALIVLLTGSRCGEAKRPKPLGFELYLSRTPFGPRITGWKPLYPADHLIPASDAAPRRLRPLHDPLTWIVSLFLLPT